MQITNEIRFKYPINQYNEEFVRDCLQKYVMQIDPIEDTVLEIDTAVSEAVTNSLEHGYVGNENGIVEILVRILPSNLLYIKVIDTGVGIENVQYSMQPFVSRDPLYVGMGFSVMESFMDKVKVRSKLGKGTCVTMMRKLVTL